MLKSRPLATASAFVTFIINAMPAYATESKLSRVFNPEMISADLAYLEQVTGPARNSYGKTKIYKVDGCEITTTVADGSVRSLRIELSHSCTFNLNNYIPNFHGRLPAPHVMTFGQFNSISGGKGQFTADCLSMCGNAADPVIYEHWQGSRADSGIEILLEVAQVGAALIAAEKWQEAMEKVEGYEWVIDTKFNCNPTKYNQVAQRAFRDVTISAITIGYDIEVPRCDF